MAKIRIDVNKLENGTAEYISLVPRGANRIPFRIIKQHPRQESDMINVGGKLDLSDIRTVLKSEFENTDAVRPSRGEKLVRKDAEPAPAPVPTPKLVGIVIEKGDHFTDEVKTELTAAGLNLENAVENDDGTLLFTQAEGEATAVIKMSENMLALVADLDPESIVEGTPVAPLFEEVGFLPSADEAMGGLSAVAKSESETISGVATYVARLTKAVPALAFKSDEIVTKACAKHKKMVAQKALDAQELDKLMLKAEPVDCPMCDGKGCKACGGDGKVMKEDSARMELLLKAFPPKKKPVAAAPVAPAAAAPAAPAAAPANAAPAAPAQEAAAPAPAAPAAAAAPAGGGDAGGGAAPEGVDQGAWDNMTPEEKSTVQAAAQGSQAPAAAPAAPAADPNAAPAAPAAAAPAAAAPAGEAPKKPNPFAKKEDGSQEADPAVTIPAMDEQVKTALETMAASIALITKSVGDLVTEVAAVKTTAQKAEATVKGTVIGGVPAEDRQPAKVVKSEGVLGIIDTAYNKSVRTQKSFVERQLAASTRTAAARR